jgi:hypothetical protein
MNPMFSSTATAQAPTIDHDFYSYHNNPDKNSASIETRNHSSSSSSVEDNRTTDVKSPVDTFI